METTPFLSQNQEQEVVNAISKAEEQTSGEIRIHIEHEAPEDPLKRAAQLFQELGMSNTKRLNGVLIYIATDDKQATIYGGEGIHQKIEDGFWDDIIAELITHFKDQQFKNGLINTIRRVGVQLAHFFPPDSQDTNELSDEISYNKNP